MVIAISLGDVTGIGPEVTLKALAQEPPEAGMQYVIIGDAGHVRRLNEQLGLRIPFEDYTRGGSARYSILHSLPGSLPLQMNAGAAEAADAAFHWLHDGARGCLSGEFDGLVTSPVNKEAIINAGHDFIGQTELLSGLAKTGRTVMMLLGQDDRGRWLRVALATTHVPIKKLAEAVTFEKVLLAIELAARACEGLGLSRSRVGVCGLNPHAGEGGKIGTEEQTAVRPAVDAARKSGLDVVGPLSADALFYYAYRGDYDAVVAMYHDQGLAPLKMVAFDAGINWTLGLPFIRTSPDHGTGYDIAGRGVARHTSMSAAIALARTLASRRNP